MRRSRLPVSCSRCRSAWSRSNVVVHDQRGMIRKPFVLVHVRGARLARERLAHNLIIDAPADTLRARLPAIGPPGVLLFLRIDLAKRVDPAAVAEELIEPRPLVRQEAGVLLIRTPVLQVDVLVRDVPVAANDVVTAPAAQAREVRRERFEKAILRCLPLRSR